MSGFEQVSALIDEGHGYYDIDNGFNNDIIGLHVTNVNELYELNNDWTNKSKTTKSEQSYELESDGSDVVTAESEGTNELVPFMSKKRDALFTMMEMPTKTFDKPNWASVNMILSVLQRKK